MNYEAIARKYRPRTFAEVVGQEPIVLTLQNAIREGRIHHAYVFSGVRGVGKTTVARIFAKALNCAEGPTATPCLRCDPCAEIAAGRNLDVIEMDAASRTGVDDVRDLIDTTRYAPARDRHKVFIIDEFHMLSRPAFNALLKTLEEPPPGVVFLMATTELHKVPPTVLSRTQQFDFRKVALGQIADQLELIAKKEGAAAPRSCLEMLARAADGSVRDAESLLDQAIAFCGATLRDADVRTLLGLVPEQTVESFLAAAAERDAGTLIRTIGAALDEGYDLRVFHAGLIEGARKLLLLRALDEPCDILGLEKGEAARLSALADKFTTEELLRIFSLLAALEGPLKHSDHPRFVFEAAAVKLAAIADLAPIEELIARLEEPGASAPRPPTAPGSGSRSAALHGGRQSAPALQNAGRPAERSAPSIKATPPKTPPTKTPRGASAQVPGAADALAATDAPGATRVSGAAPVFRSAPVPGAARESGPGDEFGPADSEPDADIDAAPGFAAESGPAGEFDPALASEAADSAPGADCGPAPAPGPAHDRAAVTDEPERIERFLGALRKRKESLAGLIEGAASLSFEEAGLVLTFKESQVFARKSVEQPANMVFIREAALDAEGRPVGIAVRRASAGATEAPRRSAGQGAAIPGATAPREGFMIRSGASRATLDSQPAPARPTAARRFPLARSSGRSGEVSPGEGEEAAVTTGGGDGGGASAPPATGAAPGASHVPVTSLPSALPSASRAPSVIQQERPRDRRAPAQGDEQGQAEPRYQRLQALALEDPAVKSMIQRFGGRIVDIKEVP